MKEGAGMSQRNSHFLTIALCQAHHTGAEGLHGLGTKLFYARYRLEEVDLLAETINGVAQSLMRGSA
jgi:hypothetical protein